MLYPATKMKAYFIAFSNRRLWYAPMAKLLRTSLGVQ